MNIPGFKLGREYASGHYYKDFNALSLSNHKTVNIQVFEDSLLISQSFVNQFREITAKLAGARFGIMTPVLQAELSDQTCYIVSEYFPNPQQLTKAPPNLTREQLLQFALQLAHTLDRLHKAGLVHGAIELSALHFSSADQLLLRPVALQRAIPMLRPMTFKSLEPAQKCYLAPEAAEALTPASDFYALGVVLYQLMFNPVPLDMSHSGGPERWQFEGEYQDLEPFFRHLLAPDAVDRIRNFDQFNAALELCGVELPETVLPPVNATQDRSHQVAAEERSSRTFSKWILPATGLALAVVAGILLLPSLGKQTPEPQDTAQAEASDSAITETENVEQPPLSSQEQPEERSPNPANLYQQALLLEELDPQAALQSANLVLEQQPDHHEALLLKQRIERDKSIRSIIASAERQLRESKLLQPSGDNAYESYMALADMLSPDDERVRKGFALIAAAYHGQAESLFEQNRLDSAQASVDLGLSVAPDYQPLIDLRTRIKEQKNVIQRKKRLARLAQQRQREAEKRLQEQQKETAIPQPQQAPVQQQKAQAPVKAQNDERLVRQQEEERLKRATIDALLSSANGYLNNGELSLDNVFSAHRKYEELRKLDYSDPGVSQLQKDLMDAYSILAIRQNDDELYKLALQALEKGVQLNPLDRKKLQFKSQLSR